MPFNDECLKFEKVVPLMQDADLPDLCRILFSTGTPHVNKMLWEGKGIFPALDLHNCRRYVVFSWKCLNSCKKVITHPGPQSVATLGGAERVQFF